MNQKKIVQLISGVLIMFAAIEIIYGLVETLTNKNKEQAD